MYLGECAIDQYLTFAICTKQPAAYDNGGNAVDADSPPAYRIYEEETATPIITGTMDKLDDGNTLGFYTENIQLTDASGFEDGKFYTIYISYEVSAVVMTEHRSFQMKALSSEPLVNYIYSRVGIPIDLGDGASLAENMSSIAGKTAGAASFNRTYDSLEALSDAEASGVTLTDMKNLLFKRNVTARHPNDKPKTIEAGDGTSAVIITTTLDGVAVEQIQTEDYV